MKKTISILMLVTFIVTACNSQKEGTMVRIKTNMGNIDVKLYDDTPIHKQNFLKLARENYFDGKIFHRVINEFMIQAGESATGEPNAEDKDTISAEFRFPEYYHKRGALAAARFGDDVNPTKASDAHQFYIVTGKKVYMDGLSNIEKARFENLKRSLFAQLQSAKMDTIKAMYKSKDTAGIQKLRSELFEQAEQEAAKQKSKVTYTPEQKEVYSTIGGTPFLDGEYTVFGEVTEGMDIVDKIQRVQTNQVDRPLLDVIIEKVEILNE